MNNIDYKVTKSSKDILDNLSREDGLAYCVHELACSVSFLLPLIRSQRFENKPISKKQIKEFLENSVNYLMRLANELGVELEFDIEDWDINTIPVDVKQDSFLTCLYALAELESLTDIIWVKTNSNPTEEEDLKEIIDSLENYGLAILLIAQQHNIEL